MPKLSLSMIVKNEEKYLRGCLGSVQGIADEIVIVDTGSTDNTIKIAEEFGAKIFHFDWINDFSAARNFALSKSTGDWILYLDADERLNENSINELKRIINKNEKLAVNCTVRSIDEKGGTPNLMLYPRLFKNNAQLKFTGKVHEQISDSIRKLNYKLIDSSIEISHLGYNISQNEIQKKAERNLELLKKEYEQNPNGYNAFQLAQTLIILNKKDEAKNYLIKAATDKNLEKNYRAHSYRFLSAINLDRNNLSEAQKNIDEALKINGSLVLVNFMASKIYLRNGDINKADEFISSAIKLNKDLLNGKKKSNFDIMADSKILLYYALNFSAENNLQNSFQKYLNELKQILLKDDLPLWKIIESLLLQKKLSENEKDFLLNKLNGNSLDFFVAVIANLKDLNEKENLLCKISVKYSNYIKAKNLLAGIYAASGKINEAVNLYEESLAIEKNPATYFYLISAFVQLQNFIKVKELLLEVEEVFTNFPVIMHKIETLKEKLKPYL